MADFDYFDERFGRFLDGKHRPGRDDPKWVDPRRTKEKGTNPYNYDEFFHFGDRRDISRAKADYSDRLWQWDYDKADRLWKQLVGTRWAHATRGQLSAFISAYYDKKLQVVALAEGCNPATGYPYFILWYKEQR